LLRAVRNNGQSHDIDRQEADVHIPDGFIGAGTSAGAGVVATGGVAWSLQRARNVLADRTIPLAGLVAAYVFAAQMLNFPVASGTSGHLIGGVLAAVLVGPWVGALCVTVVLAVQALVFADGGLSALGLNVVNMALVGAIGGYAVFVAVRSILPPGRRAILTATAVAAWTGPVLAATAFTVEYALGGNGAVSTTTALWAMLGVHALIGIGEAVITTLTVGAVLASRPDLVYGAARGDVGGAVDAEVAASRRRPFVGFVAVAAVVIALLAAGASPFASSSPDGLEKVAAEKGIDAGAVESAVADSPVADYGVAGIDDERLGTSVAGVVGVTITVAAGLGLFALVRRRSARHAA
jgi:cobalt/nickel transport system permease protein